MGCTNDENAPPPGGLLQPPQPPPPPPLKSKYRKKRRLTVGVIGEVLWKESTGKNLKNEEKRRSLSVVRLLIKSPERGKDSIIKEKYSSSSPPSHLGGAAGLKHKKGTTAPATKCVVIKLPKVETVIITPPLKPKKEQPPPPPPIIKKTDPQKYLKLFELTDTRHPRVWNGLPSGFGVVGPKGVFGVKWTGPITSKEQIECGSLKLEGAMGFVKLRDIRDSDPRSSQILFCHKDGRVMTIDETQHHKNPYWQTLRCLSSSYHPSELKRPRRIDNETLKYRSNCYCEIVTREDCCVMVLVKLNEHEILRPNVELICDFDFDDKYSVWHQSFSSVCLLRAYYSLSSIFDNRNHLNRNTAPSNNSTSGTSSKQSSLRDLRLAWSLLLSLLDAGAKVEDWCASPCEQCSIELNTCLQQEVLNSDRELLKEACAGLFCSFVRGHGRLCDKMALDKIKTLCLSLQRGEEDRLMMHDALLESRKQLGVLHSLLMAALIPGRLSLKSARRVLLDSARRLDQKIRQRFSLTEEEYKLTPTWALGLIRLLEHVIHKMIEEVVVEETAEKKDQKEPKGDVRVMALTTDTRCSTTSALGTTTTPGDDGLSSAATAAAAMAVSDDPRRRDNSSSSNSGRASQEEVPMAVAEGDLGPVRRFSETRLREQLEYALRDGEQTIIEGSPLTRKVVASTKTVSENEDDDSWLHAMQQTITLIKHLKQQEEARHRHEEGEEQQRKTDPSEVAPSSGHQLRDIDTILATLRESTESLLPASTSTDVCPVEHIVNRFGPVKELATQMWSASLSDGNNGNNNIIQTWRAAVGQQQPRSLTTCPFFSRGSFCCPMLAPNNYDIEALSDDWNHELDHGRPVQVFEETCYEDLHNYSAKAAEMIRQKPDELYSLVKEMKPFPRGVCWSLSRRCWVVELRGLNGRVSTETFSPEDYCPVDLDKKLGGTAKTDHKSILRAIVTSSFIAAVRTVQENTRAFCNKIASECAPVPGLEWDKHERAWIAKTKLLNRNGTQRVITRTFPVARTDVQSTWQMAVEWLIESNFTRRRRQRVKSQGAGSNNRGGSSHDDVDSRESFGASNNNSCSRFLSQLQNSGDGEASGGDGEASGEDGEATSCSKGCTNLNENLNRHKRGGSREIKFLMGTTTTPTHSMGGNCCNSSSVGGGSGGGGSSDLARRTSGWQQQLRQQRYPTPTRLLTTTDWSSARKRDLDCSGGGCRSTLQKRHGGGVGRNNEIQSGKRRKTTSVSKKKDPCFRVSSNSGAMSQGNRPSHQKEEEEEDHSSELLNLACQKFCEPPPTEQNKEETSSLVWSTMIASPPRETELKDPKTTTESNEGSSDNTPRRASLVLVSPPSSSSLLELVIKSADIKADNDQEITGNVDEGLASTISCVSREQAVRRQKEVPLRFVSSSSSSSGKRDLGGGDFDGWTKADGSGLQNSSIQKSAAELQPYPRGIIWAKTTCRWFALYKEGGGSQKKKFKTFDPKKYGGDVNEAFRQCQYFLHTVEPWVARDSVLHRTTTTMVLSSPRRGTTTMSPMLGAAATLSPTAAAAAASPSRAMSPTTGSPSRRRGETVLVVSEKASSPQETAAAAAAVMMPYFTKNDYNHHTSIETSPTFGV